MLPGRFGMVLNCFSVAVFKSIGMKTYCLSRLTSVASTYLPISLSNCAIDTHGRYSSNSRDIRRATLGISRISGAVAVLRLRWTNAFSYSVLELLGRQLLPHEERVGVDYGRERPRRDEGFGDRRRDSGKRRERRFRHGIEVEDPLTPLGRARWRGTGEWPERSTRTATSGNES